MLHPLVELLGVERFLNSSLCCDLSALQVVNSPNQNFDENVRHDCKLFFPCLFFLFIRHLREADNQGSVR